MSRGTIQRSYRAILPALCRGPRLPDGAALIHIGQLRRSRRGSIEVQVLPSWPDVRLRHKAATGGNMRVRMPGTVGEQRTPGLDERPTEQ